MENIKRKELGQKWCYKCQSWQETTEFNGDASRPDGLMHKCKLCHRIGRRTGRPTGHPKTSKIRDEAGNKQCSTCKVWLPIQEFGVAKHTADKIEGRCRKCNTKRSNDQLNRNGNLFFARVVTTHRRGAGGDSKRRAMLRAESMVTVEFIAELWDLQNGLCAVTGVPMTRLCGAGRVQTNMSIDRIHSDRGYELDNIRLVCFAVNMMKQSMTDEELYRWCTLILNGRR